MCAGEPLRGSIVLLFGPSHMHVEWIIYQMTCVGVLE